MGYAIGNEFPNVCGEYPDIVELLALYKKLTAEYTELLKQITDTNAKLDKYMADINTMIPGWIDEATKAQQAELQKLADDVQAQITQFTNDINGLIASYDERLDIQFKNQAARVSAELAQTTTWVTNQINQMKIWTQEQVVDMKRWVTNQNSQLKQFVAGVQDEQNASISTIQGQVDGLENQLNDLSNEFIKNMEATNKQLQEWFTTFQLWYYRHRWEDKQWLMEEIDKMKEIVDAIPESSSPVYNPIMNEQTSFNQAIMDMFNYGISAGGYSARQWDLSDWITADYFDNSGITAIEFTTNAKHILDAWWQRLRMFSPVSGEYVWIGTAVQQVFDMLNPNKTTAQEYDETETAAEVYDEKMLTAEEYVETRWTNVQ